MRQLTRTLCLGLLLELLLFGVGASPEAWATTYRLRTLTVGRATQYFRADATVVAPRRLTQALALSAFDLGDDNSGSLNAHLSVRYFSDFGLEQRLRSEPLFADQWNATTLDLAYLDWRPLDALTLRLGRQWAMGSLGVRDFDGAWVRFAPTTGALVPYVELYGGRDVQLGLSAWDPSSWDVQGLPPNDDGIEGAPWHWLAGTHLGARYKRLASLDLGYRRRFRGGADGAQIVGDERLGAAVSGSPAHRAYQRLVSHPCRRARCRQRAGRLAARSGRRRARRRCRASPPDL
ncbi:MAG: hypothetical protein H0U74_00460 [Bradymonadaceae bacterium]|nr:hypothetical protein [Lujinxingiaceae bacterium]